MSLQDWAEHNRTYTTTTGSPGCGLFATCTDSKPKRCKQKVPRPTETVGANSTIKPTTENEQHFSYASLRPLLREPYRPPERWCSRHPRQKNHLSSAGPLSSSDTPINSSAKPVFANRETTYDTSVWTLSATGRKPCSCRRTSASASTGSTSADSHQFAICTSLICSRSSFTLRAASSR